MSAAGLAADTFTAWHNAAHLLAGAFGLLVVAGLRRKPRLLKWLVVLVGLAALFFGIFGFLETATDKTEQGVRLAFLSDWAVSSISEPLGNLFHIGFAAWALVSAFLGTPPSPQRASAGVQAPSRS